MRQEHFGGGDGLPYVALSVFRGVYQQSAERGRKALAADGNWGFEGLADDCV